MNADDLLLISVGGAAATIARRVAENASAPLRALILDTDDATLQAITPAVGVSTTVFGAKRLAGRGTGGDRNLGASALRDDASQIQAQIGAPRLAVLLVCCGGGTSGAAPLLLEMLRALGVATLVFATTPFAFEGDDRHRCAKIILPTLAAQADAITTVPLELLAGGDAALPQAEAFARVADRLGAGLGLLWSLIAHAGFLPLDAERFRRFLTHDVAGGRPFCFAEAVCAGERRADDALARLLAAPRFRPDGVDCLANASQIVVGVLAGPDLRLCELGVLMTGLRAHCVALQEAYLGTANEASREGTLAVVVLAFGQALAEGGGRVEEGVHEARGGGRSRKGAKAKAAARANPLGAARNRFNDVEPTLHGDQNLDTPTYLRRGIRLAR